MNTLKKILALTLLLFCTFSALAQYPNLPPGEGPSLVKGWAFASDSNGNYANAWQPVRNDPLYRMYQWPFVSSAWAPSQVPPGGCIIESTDVYSARWNTVKPTGRIAVATIPNEMNVAVKPLTATLTPVTGDAGNRVTVCNSNSFAVGASTWLEASYPTSGPPSRIWASSVSSSGEVRVKGFNTATLNGCCMYMGYVSINDSDRNANAAYFKTPPLLQMAPNGDFAIVGQLSGFDPNALPSARINPAAGAGYATLTNLASGYCLTIDRNVAAQGAPGMLGACNGDYDRQFVRLRTGGAQAMLQLQINSRCLDLPLETTAFGAQVVSGTCTTHDSQRWYFLGHQIVNANSGLCLDVAYHRTDLKAPVTQGTCDANSVSQQWTYNGQ